MTGQASGEQSAGAREREAAAPGAGGLLGQYGPFLAHPGVAWPAGFGLLARLANGMLGLVFMLTAVEVTGSYAAAGATAALFTAASTVATPLWSRAADRLGPAPVLLVTGGGEAAVLSAEAWVTLGDGPGGLPLTLLAVTASGALLPPVSAVMRTQWSRMFAGSALRATAFAYETMVTDVVFIAGPAVVAGLTASASPGLALIAAAVATVAGCGALATGSRLLPGAPGGPRERHWLGALRSRRVRALLPVGFLLTGSISVIEVSLVSSADQEGRPDAAGVLIALLSVGGVAGGLLWGRRRQEARPRRDLLVWTGALTVGWGLLALAPHPWVLAGLLLLAGLALNPALTAQFSAMDDAAPPELATEAFGWLNGASSAGLTAGAAAVGPLVEAEAGHGFLVAAAMCAAGTALIAAGRPRAGTAPDT
ncbi:MFS transporter [Streptomyces hoynatensis]|uniref:MFS transporter n=1 Tax=Streptomyces hoynatensis TaxID=1141874 RepID=A0A3A9Z9J3_9ACTN|nr:MFS transporter [Streptomyces hoynatensis]RKN43986.1 MFS transporter [Streptomyces hoynatensis]